MLLTMMMAGLLMIMALMEMFEELAPVLEDASDLFVECDDGVNVLVVKDGKCIQEI